MSVVKRVAGLLPDLPRGRKARLGAVAAVVAATLAGVALSMAPASAKHHSPCENGVAVGRICHYVYIVSEGPDYDADMEMQTLDGYPYQGVDKWHESNPTYTRWFWDYDQNATSVDFKLHLRIYVRGTNNGWEGDLAGDRDTCFQISKSSKQVFQVQCPNGGGIG